MRMIISTIAAFVAGLGWALSTATAAAPTVIKFKPYLDGQLAFDTTIGGRTETFLFDTGGGATVISPAFAARIGCTPWGQVTGFRMRGERLDLQRCEDVRITVAGLTLVSPTAAEFDITQGAPKDAPPLAGSVALDAFAGRTVTLDVAHQRLIVETPASLAVRIRHAREVAARFARDLDGIALEPLVALDTPKGRVWLTIDCGSDGDVTVNRPLAAALGLDPAHKGHQILTMKFAGGPQANADARVDDLIIDGNIGVRVLRHWIITIDTARQRIWLAPSGV
jgi:predicted aspartyl protease